VTNAPALAAQPRVHSQAMVVRRLPTQPGSLGAAILVGILNLNAVVQLKFIARLTAKAPIASGRLSQRNFHVGG